uniref:Uncharacterized protein n=1 Tax=Arundo donax TaxID=35708 RepID=A0A0A8YMM0_ARUDO
MGSSPSTDADSPVATPVQDPRACHVVPANRLTYSQGHVRAQGRRQRPKRAKGYGPDQ